MATRKLQITAVAAALLLLLSLFSTSDAQVFDVTKYGANPDGKSSIDQALMSAWKLACESSNPSKIVIPKGTFALKEVKLRGPCKVPVEIDLQGTVRAPADPSEFETDGWVTFEHIDGLTLSGGGVFDGQGKIAWEKNKCHENSKCKMILNLRFNFVTNALVRDITTLDSKNFHVNVLGCKNFTFLDFTVSAPEDSLNTDGIHIGRSDGVYITNTKIATGDDCISLGDGSKNVHVTGVKCGPGHGISVGSLGKYPGEEPVSGLWVTNCTLKKTSNGVRIKTWPASYPGSVSDLHFENIDMVDVGNPVLIDQVYCPWNQCKADIPSLVKISNVSFKNIRGTSSTELAVKLTCSSKIPCKDVVVGDIDLVYTGQQSGKATSECSNIVPSLLGMQSPRVC